MASGDTAYVGAGVYREAVTVAMTSATGTTKVIGDVYGQFTGDAGEVIWTNYTNGWHNTASGTAPLVLNGRDFLWFENIYFNSGGSTNAINGNTVHSSDITFKNCFFQSVGGRTIEVTASFATALNWTVDRCLVFSPGNIEGFRITHTSGVGSDWDLNVQITDSTFLGSNTPILVICSGASANEGGGVDLLRCTIWSNAGFVTSGTKNSLTFPCTVQDCMIFSSASGINAGEAGAITDLGGNLLTAGLTNTTAHATTRTSSNFFPALPISFAHEWMWGMTPRRALSPILPEAYSVGHIGSATTDMEQRSRPEGSGRFIDSGTATAGAATTLTDSGKAWKTNEHVGRRVRLTGGTGSGAQKHISSNTATVLTIGGLSGDWETTPDSTSTYIIYEGPPAETAKATSGSTTTFVVSGAAWSTNQWAGYTLQITAGTQSGNSRTIASNTSTTLTTAAFAGAIDSTSVGSIYFPSASLTAALKTPGALEMHETALKETTTTDAGSVGIVINSPGSHEFRIPVDASSTTISVKARYDSSHGTTNKPQAILLANGEIGVTTETKTMTSAADTWETLTFAAQTPTAKGVVIVRVVSRSDTPYGRAYFDTWTVT